MQSVKCVIVGDDCGAVHGVHPKASVKVVTLITYASDAFPEHYVPTVADSYAATVALDGRPVALALWDTSAAAEDDRARPLRYQHVDVFLLLGTHRDRVPCVGLWRHYQMFPPSRALAAVLRRW